MRIQVKTVCAACVLAIGVAGQARAQDERTARAAAAEARALARADRAMARAQWMVMDHDVAATTEHALAMARDAAAAAFAGFGEPQQPGDDLYREGRNLIDQGQFDRAIAEFRKLAETTQARADGALYWIAYAQYKLNQRAEALNTLGDLQRRFASSRWTKDGKALEVEIRQASGQKVSPDLENDEELKLLALRGLMDSSPDRAIPMLQQLLSGNNPPKVKDRALFVLTQSHSPEAKTVIVKVAKDSSNADLQLRAVKYVGIMGGEEGRTILADVYKSAADQAVKRAVLRSLMVAGDRTRLLAVAKTETAPELRAEAVQQLGVMGAQNELGDLYQTETSIEVKKKILQGMFVGGGSAKLMELAKTEKDPELRRTAVRDLGLINSPATGDALASIYNTDPSPDIRKAAIDALFIQNNAHALVTLAKAEKNPEMKKAIVSKLSLMKSKEATDYLMELLK